MRQYIAQGAPDRDGILIVQGKDYRYFRQVLRLTVGDMVDVRLPDGRLQQMTVCHIDEGRRQIVLQVCADTGLLSTPLPPAALTQFVASGEAAAMSQNELWLFQFVARSAKMDIIIRQATECGVSVIVPVTGDFSQAGGKERNFRSDRYERIIKEARQQSGSAVATRVHETCTLDEAIALWKAHCTEAQTAFSPATGVQATDVPPAGATATVAVAPSSVSSLGLVLYERTEQTQPLHTAVSKVRKEAGAACCLYALVCGSEGGISPAELNRLIAAGFVPIHFKTNILRCETAALYGIAALQTAIAEESLWQCKE